MRRQRVFTLAFALCCLLVLASLSASLDSTVSTTPDDVIDLDYGSLPLTVQDAAELRETYESGQPEQDGETSEVRQSDADSQNSDRSDSVDSDASDANAERSEAESDAQQAEGAGSENDSAPAERDRGLLAMLWALLETLLASLPALLLIGTVALAAHQRDRLLAWFKAHLRGIRSTDADSTADAVPAPSFRPPANRIERAWLKMLSESDIDPDPSATPRECAEQLVRAGFDKDAVRELTAMFEEVRYDETPATADRVHRALHCLRRSRGQEVVE